MHICIAHRHRDNTVVGGRVWVERGKEGKWGESAIVSTKKRSAFHRTETIASSSSVVFTSSGEPWGLPQILLLSQTRWLRTTGVM